MNKKILVIGLDGAEPMIVDALVRKGRLPNISKIIKRSVYGSLKSTFPAASSIAWTSFMTGKNPGKHGVFGFVERKLGTYNTRIVSSLSIHGKTLWEILSEAGRKVVVMNMPVTYPPKRVNGILISGLIAPMESISKNFTYPESLGQILIKQGYKVEPDPLMYQSIDAYTEEVFNAMKARAKLALALYCQHKPNFFIVVFVSADRLQHYLWKYMDENHPAYNPKDAEKYGDIIYKCYEKLDATIGGFLQMLDNDTVLILMSDHGFGPAYKKVSIINFLIKERLLTIRWSWKTILLQFGITDTAIYHFLGKLRMFNKLRKIIHSNVKNTLQGLQPRKEINWLKTKAYTIDGKSIYINLKRREPDGVVSPDLEYERMRREIIKRLYRLVDPETGNQVVEKVFKKEEIYFGPHVERAPDLIAKFKRTYRHSTKLEPHLPVIAQEDWYSGVHHDCEDAFYSISGEGLSKGKYDNIAILDVPAIILYLMGLPIPKDMDGKVLTEIFEPEILKMYPVRYVEPLSEKARIKEKIKRLKMDGRL